MTVTPNNDRLAVDRLKDTNNIKVSMKKTALRRFDQIDQHLGVNINK